MDIVDWLQVQFPQHYQRRSRSTLRSAVESSAPFPPPSECCLFAPGSWSKFLLCTMF